MLTASYDETAHSDKCKKTNTVEKFPWEFSSQSRKNLPKEARETLRRPMVEHKNTKRVFPEVCFPKLESPDRVSQKASPKTGYWTKHSRSWKTPRNAAVAKTMKSPILTCLTSFHPAF